MIDKIRFKSGKIFKKNRRIYDTVSSIQNTRRSIDAYYSNEISSDSLIKQLNKLDFLRTQDYPIELTIIAGVITGLISSMVIDYSNFQFTNNVIVNFFLSITILIFTIIFIIIMVLYLYYALRHIYTNNYRLYIVSYECEVIRNKLRTDYTIEL
jgi:uncharacterized membrane protein